VFTRAHYSKVNCIKYFRRCYYYRRSMKTGSFCGEKLSKRTAHKYEDKLRKTLKKF